ncbi:hypothetical protein KAT92_03535 [Candidatus Babeliales bacterium]|nr:hypothetical protein [Candidatus Babeliales bacterium]
MINLLKVKKYLLSFLQFQAVATATSLPILVYWGMPISLMTVVGNFIFTPFLSVFLLISSLIFFTELFFIPNQLLVILLDWQVTTWNTFLTYSSKSWLIAFAKPSPLLAALFALLALLIFAKLFFTNKSKRLTITTFLSCTLIIIHCSINLIIPVQESSDFVPKTNNKLCVMQHKNKAIEIIDNGFFARKQSPGKYISFELKPYICKKYGTTRIDTIVLRKPGTRSIQAAEELCESFLVKKVSIAYFEKPLSKYGWRCFFGLRRKVKGDGVKWERFKTS